LELIEDALQTQKKILSMQSEAGRTGARQKLFDLKQLISRIGKSKQPATRPEPMSWSFFARTILGDVQRLDQSR
jgi:hypothetical protein